MKISNAIEGMQIIAKNMRDQHCLAAEHDELYCGSIRECSLTPDEEARMIELGWIKDESMDSWKFFT